MTDARRPRFHFALSGRSSANLYRGYLDDEVLGVFVPTWLELPFGTRVELVIEVPTGEVLELEGAVAFHRTAHSDSVWPGLGVAFVEIADAERIVFQRLARQREPMFFDN